jgi:predicted RNA binding protein YcfA (HicA-like mRNA interferase family)
MPKLRTLSGAQVRAILEAHGFVLARHDGTSHMIMQKTTTTSTITVVVPAHKTIKTGTLTGIIRQSGLGRGPFES